MLFVFVSAAFISLLDNYESDTGEPEIVTPEEVAENHKFLDAIIKTPTMKVPVGTSSLTVAHRSSWRIHGNVSLAAALKTHLVKASVPKKENAS